MPVDLLADAGWECLATGAGLVDDPAQLAAAPGEWMRATVPGTVAGALREAGATDDVARDLDAVDWWFRTRFDSPTAMPDALLTIGGLATLGDVWCNGEHIAQTENMFVAQQCAVPVRAGENEVVLRCRSLTTAMQARRPRPRWKTYLVANQQLRWFRTSLLGRLPGWAEVPPIIGPWRPITLTGPVLSVADRRVVARCDGTDGVVELHLELLGRVPATAEAVVRVGDASVRVAIETSNDTMLVDGVVRVPNVRRWWPHTHGDQPRYPMSIAIDDELVDLGSVGFRTVTVDRADDRFVVVVNDVPIFTRGACWFPPDPVTMNAPPDDVRATLALARDAHFNMVRVPATSAYPDESFWDACDELGLLVWQDCMFAFMDYPDDDAFCEEVRRELVANLAPIGGRPSLAIVCGNQEVEEIPAMQGLPREKWEHPLFDKTVSGIVHDVVPDVPYVPSNPTGGDLSFLMNTGVSQYFGVGGYLRSLADVRRDDVRFAAECFAFANPPERDFVDGKLGGAVSAGHDPGWKRGVHHDAGRSWDMDDVRDFYVRELFKVDPLLTRYTDPERALDLGRAASAELLAGLFTEWRRPGSASGGGLVLALRDLRAGAGWGLIDSRGVPKSPYYALRRVSQPLAVLLTDEGLNGLRAHICNDAATPFAGTLSATLYARGELAIEEAQLDIQVDAQGAHVVDIATMFDGFRDLTYAFRFAPSAHDVVGVRLHDDEGRVRSTAVFLPLGFDRPFEDDLGLTAQTALVDDRWTVTVSSKRFAQSVAVEAPGFIPDDSWFHLLPGESRAVVLTARPTEKPQPPRGSVRALNARRAAPIRAEAT